MIDSGDRDRDTRSLLAFGRSAAVPAGTLAVPEAETAEITDDPVERHRRARSRRQARGGTLVDALASSGAAPAGAEAAKDEADQRPAAAPQKGRFDLLLPGWLTSRVDGRPRGAADAMDDDGAVDDPQAFQAETLREERPGPANDGIYWKPLVDPMAVIGGVGRSKALIASTTILGALLGVAMALSTPKKYESSAELLADPRDLKLVDRNLTQDGLPSDATLAIVENQVRILTSGTVLNKVVDKLRLDLDPEFNGEDGSFSLGLREVVDIARKLVSGGSADGGGQDLRRALAVSNLGKALTVARGGRTFVIVVTVLTRSGEKSALIANTMTEVFLETYGELQSQTAGRAEGEILARLEELRTSVEAAERKVERYKADNDLIDAQGRLITDDEIVSLNGQLSQARARTLELNARAASARAVDVDTVVGGALPEQVASSVLAELRGQYASLKQEADRQSVRLGPRHPERQALDTQLAGLRDQIGIELRRVVSSIQVELKRAVQLEQELASRLAQLKVRQGDVNTDMVSLRELERDAKAKRDVYEAFLLRARETGEQKDINSANISVISTAYPPLDPVGPSRATIALTFTALGFASGVGLGAFRGAYGALRGRSRPARKRRSRRGQDAGLPISAAAGSGTAFAAGDPARAGQPAEGPGRRPDLAADKAAAPAGDDADEAAGRAGMDMRSEASAQAMETSMQDPYAPYRSAPPPGWPAAPVQPVHPQQQQWNPPAVHPAWQQPYPPAGQPPFAMAYPPAGWPQQPHWQAPHGYPATAWPSAMPAHPWQSAQQPAPQPGWYPAPPAPAQAEGQQQASMEAETQTPIEEIRASLREFRDAVKELTESRKGRRYF